MTNRTYSRFQPAARRLLGVAAIVAVTAAGGACADDDLDRLTAPALDEVTPSADLIAAEPWAALAIEDALTRLIPSLAEPAAAAPLQAALAALQQQLERGDDKAALGAVTAAENGLDAYERFVGPGGPDAADLDAIRLALADVTA